jgi:transglutaminase-like putative cysteine protease
VLSDNAHVLKLPYRGAPQTIGTMKHAALRSQGDFAVRSLAEGICERLLSKDYTSEAIALYNFVCAATRYMRDPRTVELVKAPYRVVQELLAGKIPQLDCDDQAAFLAALLLATGCEVRLATVAFRRMIFQGMVQYSHVFVQAREPRTGAWITLDPVAGDRTREMLSRVVAVAYWPIA